MKAVVLAGAVLWCAPIAARADALFEFTAHEPPRAASRVVETACEIEVDVRGGVATVELRQHLENTGMAAVAAAYEQALPDGGVMIGATLRDGSAPENTALAVPHGFTTTVAHDGDVIGADPLVVEPIDSDDGLARYRATLQPIEVGHAVVMTTRWATTVTIDGGALHVDVPGRDANGQLPACHGTVRAVAGPGATIARVRAGKGVGSGGAATFTLEDAAVAIDAELAFARPEPLAWTQREDLGGGWAGELVTVLAPPARTSAPVARRAMFVIDGSRSMAMIGAPAISQVVDAVAAALPAGTQLDAIVYDRTAARVLGSWQPADRAVGAIVAAVAKHAAGNGSDLAAALRLAHTALADGAREETSIIVITDGVLGQLPDTALVDAIAANPSAVNVHAIVLDPGTARSPGKALLARPVSMYGGSYVEIAADELDSALTGVDAWVRPAWLEVAVHGIPADARGELPSVMRAGAGGTQLFATRGAAPALELVAHAETMARVAARPAAAAPVGALALAHLDILAFAASSSATDLAAATRVRERAIGAHPIADLEHALVVLSAAGKVARDRRAMVAGGGPYTRVAALEDPEWIVPIAHARAAAPAPSAIDQMTLERLFRDQLQPAAFVCYERALGTAPKLAGTVRFELHLGRGEVTHAEVAGIGDAAFDACLVDAAYRMTPPLPDLRVNADDQTIAHYPLTFGLADHHPTVVLGDADSSSPLDIDAIEGGIPVSGPRDAPIHVDTATPLGAMKPR